MPSGCSAIVLHLKIRAKDGCRERLLEFLREAKPFYETDQGAGSIRMRLLQDMNDPDAFIEIFEYETRRAYELDEQQVQHDPQMKAYLARWRELLAGPPVVEVYLNSTDAIA